MEEMRWTRRLLSQGNRKDPFFSFPFFVRSMQASFRWEAPPMCRETILVMTITSENVFFLFLFFLFLSVLSPCWMVLFFFF